MVNYLIDKSIQNLERCRNELNTIVVCIVKSSILPPTVKTSFVSGTRSGTQVIVGLTGYNGPCQGCVKADMRGYWKIMVGEEL